MKKILSAVLLLLSLNATSQDISQKNVDLHLPKYKAQMQEGKWFMITGAIIQGIGAAVVLSDTKDREEIGGGIATIGGVFGLWGFVRIAGTNRHLKRSDAFQRNLAVK